MIVLVKQLTAATLFIFLPDPFHSLMAVMKNNMIRDRLSAFQAELSQKRRDTGFTVGETCFICERAALLIRDYCRPGIEPLKSQTLLKLREALDRADQYYDDRRGKKQQNAVSFTQVVGPAREAITTFLAEAC